MSDHIEETVAALQEKIGGFEREIIKVKTTINQLLDLDGKPPMYQDADLLPGTSGAIAMNVRADEFFGKPLATCVRAILERRAAMNLGAGSLDEICDVLRNGGFDFENKNEGIAKRNVAIALSKNPAFQRTPKGDLGLREWYGNKMPKKQRNGKPDDPVSPEDNSTEDESGGEAEENT